MLSKILQLAFLLLIPSFVQAQKSIHLKKQQSNFLFACLNTQVRGEYLFQDEQNFYLDNTNVRNLFMLRYEHKNRKILQLGYVKKFALKGWSLLLNTESDANIRLAKATSMEVMPLNLRVNLLFNFTTKWDRTSIAIGSKNLAYGHHPKIDAFFNFTPTLAKLDLGFNRDIGIFTRFPLNEKLDFDGSLTLGGFLGKPFVRAANDDTNKGVNVKFNPTSYKNTFLITTRVGSPSHNRQELGVFSAIGNIVDQQNQNETAITAKFGGEYIYKFSDHLLFLQKLSIGMYHPNSQPNAAQFRTQFMTSIDYTFRGWMVVALNNALLHKKGKIDGTSTTYGLLTTTAGLILNPNLQARINLRRNYLDGYANDKFEFFFQVILGLGQRP